MKALLPEIASPMYDSREMASDIREDLYLHALNDDIVTPKKKNKEKFYIHSGSVALTLRRWGEVFSIEYYSHQFPIKFLAIFRLHNSLLFSVFREDNHDLDENKQIQITKILRTPTADNMVITNNPPDAIVEITL